MKANNIKLLIFTILSFASSIILTAQKGSIHGIISDAETGESLISATLRIGSIGVVTDFDGKYSLELATGTHTLIVDYIGYESLEQEIQVEADTDKEINISLKSSALILETATVTSGKYSKPLGEVTVSMEVIKPRLIEASNSTSVDEVLDKVPGVSIADGQANIRGGSGWAYGAGSRVLLLIDDIPALQADAGFPNWDDIPVENIEQVEVVKGAASALYGSSAMNGIINIRTSYPKSEPETHVSVYNTAYGNPEDPNKKWWGETDSTSFKTPFQRGISFAHRRKIKKFDLVFGAYTYKIESFRKDTDILYGRFNFNIRYRISDRLSAGINANFNFGDRNNYFYWTGTDCECGSYIGDSTTLSSRKFFRYTIDPFVSYFDRSGNRHKLLGRYYSIDNKVSNDQSNASQLIYGEYQFQRNLSTLDLVLTAGIVASNARSDSRLFGDSTYIISNTAAYLQLDKKLFNRLNLSGGVRYERNAIDGPDSIYVRDEVFASGKYTESRPVFRLGANYQVGKYTYLRSSWGQGYRFPTLAEKFISTLTGGLNIVPNPALISETGWTVELGLKQGFRISEFNGFLDISVFQSEYTDMMEFELKDVVPIIGPSGTLEFQAVFQSNNVGNTRIRGLDVSIGSQGQFFGVETNFIAGYTYIDPQFKDFDLSGKELPVPLPDSISLGQRNAKNSTADFNVLKYRSKHSIKFDLESKIKQFSIAISGNYASNIEAIDWAFGFLPANLLSYREKNTKGYKTFNLRLGYEIIKGLKVTLIGKNIFNEEYTLRPGLLEAPRNGTVRVDWKF